LAPSSLIPEEEKVPEVVQAIPAAPQSEAQLLDPAISGIITQDTQRQQIIQ
jgi:hypothetical protein